MTDNDPTTTVDLDGAQILVTPVNELPFPWSLTAAVISSRIFTKLSKADVDGASNAPGVDEDIYQLLEVCVEDGIKRETLVDLGPYDLTKVLKAAFPEGEPEGEDDS